MGKLGQTVISTYASTNYSFVLQKGKAVGILVEGNGEKNFYTFNKDDEFPTVDNQLLEVAFKALIRANANGFDILQVCFFGFEEEEEYRNIATKVFKEYINELYNSACADDAFERPVNLSSIGETYDFWEDFKQSK